MKFNYIIKQSAGFLSLLILLSISACKKENTDKELGALPTADQVKFTVTPSTTNANVVTLVNESPGFKALWDFGNGGTADGNTVTASYPLAGTYNVKLTIVTDGGSVSSTKAVVIANTNPAMLTDPAFTTLSGGLSNASGFTWVIDQKSAGHLGVGPITSQAPDWYQAAADEKTGLGFYDDEMTFNMNGLKYTYDNKGTTFANASNAPGIGGPAGANDPTVNYTPATNLTWLITETNGVKYLTISGGGFISYYLGVSQYQILSLNENEMWLRCLDKANAGNAWYLKLVKKGYVRPVVQKPLQAANLSDDFQNTANFTWTTENIDFTRPYDNPAKFPVNTSAKVGYYEKRTGDEGQYGNLNVTLPYRFNLATTNKIRLKVFFPGGNNFTKTPATVSVKLQNSLLGGNAWQTQTEIVKTITPLQYNSWVQLEFDYSGISTQTLYDKIVVQLGGEGHPNPGIFYVDDFEFK
ncbi:PKD domain-containing protein [Pedobacter endophyticus]|uniref:PKD domain-containing protein n=1 Tax=Pedobacter endophyticus TaxID=2789740 RepID=A0A7U3Q4K3_9SPHI|nr:PKD domain-containing protein [Pedobacter endophyticus]QPH38485.1 PKD domain-containing protein [Pedobacter endophyticus]